ncbi:MAG: UbiD family decarboxylase, partial [Actinobacteria bacterium]|nr:UbiD family decarboxylase [Actinomycetota bacterium]
MPRFPDMRSFLSFLEEKKDILYLDEEVDPHWEVNGITRIVLQNEGPCVVFRNIKGADYPCVTGMLATGQRFLWALGLTEWSTFNEWWAKQTETLIPPRIVPSGPCQEVEISGEDIDLTRICNIKWHSHDFGGSAGETYGEAFPGTLSVSITKDPDTGLQNAGIYRMGTLSRNTLGWGAPAYTHGRQHYMKYEAQGKPMPMAVITGYDPITEIVSCARTGPGVDEFHLAGALMGEPMEMVKCRTIDLEVPATAEWVFEGYIYPGNDDQEGGFGEYTGYYGETRTNPVYVVTHITHRKDPLYLGTREQWYPSESAVCVGRSSQAEAYKTLKKIVPGILDLRCDVT